MKHYKTALEAWSHTTEYQMARVYFAMFNLWYYEIVLPIERAFRWIKARW